jgi:hypothetical protein
MTLEDFIISVYCFIEEKMKTSTHGLKIRRAGFQPALSDAEVLTMEVVGEFIGLHQDKKIWQYFKQHFQGWFPQLKDRPSFVRQCANLLAVKNLLLAGLFNRAKGSKLHMVDGVPMPIVHFARANKSKSCAEQADYGYCASKKTHYYGFLGHVLIDAEGRLANFVLTPANGSEREALEVMSEGIRGTVLGDKGFISDDLKRTLFSRGINLQTPLRDNMQDERPKAYVKWVVSTRRLVETVIGQLTERLAINTIRVRDFFHLQSRVARKLLAHAIATFLATSCGFRPTQLDSLLTL